MTDILSFRLSPAYSELVISAETAARNARRYGKTLEEEIAYLVIHGLLHLQGYDDADERGARRMARMQDAAAAALCRTTGRS